MSTCLSMGLLFLAIITYTCLVSDKDCCLRCSRRATCQGGYIRLVQEADASVNAGNYTAVEDLENEEQGW